MSSSVNPTIFQKLEDTIGKRVLVIIERDLGFEGIVGAISQEPPGIWLSNAEVVILRSTLANPVPQVVNRENKSEVFIHLNSVLRIEVLHEV